MAKKIKVAMVIEEGRWGGPQNRIVRMASALKEYNIDVTAFIPLLYSENFENKLREKGIDYKKLNLHRISFKKPLMTLACFVFFPFEIIMLMKELKKGQFDIVQPSGGCWQWKAAIAGALCSKKVIWYLNDTKIHVIIKLIFRLIARFSADAFMVQAERVREYYLKNTCLDSLPIFNIQSPIDISEMDVDNIMPDVSINEFNTVKILTVANISPVKGIEYLIETARLLNAKYDNLSFIVIGNTRDTQQGYKTKLDDMIETYGLSNFYFMGGRDNVLSSIKASDIFVCTSLSESGPQTVWEAMVMEKPIVSTDVGAVGEYIKDGENGFVVPLKDTEAMVEKLSWLIDNKSAWKEIGEKAAKVATSEIDISVAVKKYIKAYNFLLTL